MWVCIYVCIYAYRHLHRYAPAPSLSVMVAKIMTCTSQRVEIKQKDVQRRSKNTTNSSRRTQTYTIHSSGRTQTYTIRSSWRTQTYAIHSSWRTQTHAILSSRRTQTYAFQAEIAYALQWLGVARIGTDHVEWVGKVVFGGTLRAKIVITAASAVFAQSLKMLCMRAKKECKCTY